MSEEFLTVQDICRRLRLSKPTVLELIHHVDPDRRLVSSRVGVQLRVRLGDFEDWLRRNRTHGKVAVRITRKCETRASPPLPEPGSETAKEGG